MKNLKIYIIAVILGLAVGSIAAIIVSNRNTKEEYEIEITTEDTTTEDTAQETVSEEEHKHVAVNYD